MASGFLGKSVPTANTWTLLYTVPSSKVASISINAVYTGTAIDGTLVDIATSTSATTAGAGIVASEYGVWQQSLLTLGSSLEKTGLVIDATNAPYVWVRSSQGSTSFQAYGYEE
jgi:hypothetical protein